MFIIPIGHDESRPARLPLVSLAVISLCVLVHALVRGPAARSDAESERALAEAVGFYVSHPYLKLDKEISDKVFYSRKEKMLEELLPEIAPVGENARDEEAVAAEQQVLDGMVAQFRRALASSPYAQWGFVPSRITLRGLLGCMFLHAGWLHLIGNLVIFFVMAPFLEGVWGKALFLAFYLSSGISASLLYALGQPHSSDPLIGASGAIAGVMGAFLVRCWKTNIKFFYFLFLRGGTFEAPSWLMLPLWFLGQVFNASMMARVQIRGGESVAYMAHVWGFLFGMLFALAMRRARFEEKHPPDREPLPSGPAGSPRILEEARNWLERGEKERAYRLLHAEISRGSGPDEVLDLLRHVGAQVGREEETARLLVRLVERDLLSNQPSRAASRFRLLRDRPESGIHPGARLPLIDALLREGDEEGARNLYEETARTQVSRLPAAILLSFLERARALDAKLGASCLPLWVSACLSHPEIPEARKEELRRTAPPPPVPEPPRLQATTAIPVAVQEKSLLIEAEGRGRATLPLERIRALALVRIASPGQTPYYLLDLFLHDPAPRPAPLRAIRLPGNRFSPTSLFPNQPDPGAAFRALLQLLLSIPGVKAYPGFTSNRIAKVHDFGSIPEYESTL